jgi:hypothetical protein
MHSTEKQIAQGKAKAGKTKAMKAKKQQNMAPPNSPAIEARGKF